MFDNNEEKPKKSGNAFFRLMTVIMVALCAVLVFATVLNFANLKKTREEKNKTIKNTEEKVINVSVKEIDGETFSERLTLNAELKNLNGNVNIVANVSGTIVENYVRLGDKVNKGDVLGIIDATDIGTTYKQSKIVAKADGIIVSSAAVVNQKIALGSVLYTIEPENDFVLRTSVSEKDADTIDIGAKGFFVTAGNKDVEHTASVRYISPSVNSLTRTVELELDVDKTQKNYTGLRSGNYVSLTLIKRELNNVFVVPNSAIKTYLGKRIVYVVDKDSIAHRVEIETGVSDEAVSVVTYGLRKGDRVVVQGNPQENLKVQILDKKEEI